MSSPQDSSTQQASTQQAALVAILEALVDPLLQRPWQELAAVESVSIVAGQCQVVIGLPYPWLSVEADLRRRVEAAVAPHLQGATLTLELVSRIPETTARASVAALQGVKNVIAVASGKGGVGKSTTTVNLALAMAQLGARVGILDADIYGPSQGMMLGVPSGTRPQQINDNTMAPIDVHGVQAMSMSFLIDERQPMVWRGPMASGALQQLMTQTQWQDLDYLFVDMPPGTGDIQLTLAQKMPVAGAVVVTTPQDIALLDAQKGIEMFRKVEIPVLGVVENMSLHRCTQCGHEEHIFGEGGGERIATEYQTQLLGSLPLTLKIRQQADSGQPTVIADPDSSEAGHYRAIALKVALALIGQATPAMPVFSVSDD
ncbi:iron-sulfur cluster carrier protein ApbC [Pokkaliibacter sp. MBI-7]|uniref:iron-sulfur cluster carrier protein ApbC n=1 Tax=Pokkaliibacter sp. MBI-7 TaxID=3040600 RepID=UPI00244A4C4E|nr:iron-sulfur cluster carrier protein ApbC [Pokkaliibacter sp. MBI-7]MDH2431514.1 iron-sulfur cluster carrier protein ApbC [Pokkaliibacter sp. MBI-7]